jgi:hypothetical protein
MQYNARKQQVIREIYDRAFIAAGLLQKRGYCKMRKERGTRTLLPVPAPAPSHTALQVDPGRISVKAVWQQSGASSGHAADRLERQEHGARRRLGRVRTPQP